MSESHRPDNTQEESTQNAPLASPANRSDPSAPAMFAAKPAESGGLPFAAWAVAGLVVVAVIAGLLFATRRKAVVPNSVQPLASYAASLPLSQLAMSESTSLSGGKSTFLDGHIQNTGTETITAITVQILFRNSEGMPPQIDTVPLALIRTRQPYVDTEPVAAAPLKPGDQQDFRLIFEAMPENWDTQMPEIHVIQVSAK